MRDWTLVVATGCKATATPNWKWALPGGSVPLKLQSCHTLPTHPPSPGHEKYCCLKEVQARHLDITLGSGNKSHSTEDGGDMPHERGCL